MHYLQVLFNLLHRSALELVADLRFVQQGLLVGTLAFLDTDFVVCLTATYFSEQEFLFKFLISDCKGVKIVR